MMKMLLTKAAFQFSYKSFLFHVICFLMFFLNMLNKLFFPYPTCPTSVTDWPSVFLLETLLNFSLTVNFSLLLEYQSIIS